MTSAAFQARFRVVGSPRTVRGFRKHPPNPFARKRYLALRAIITVVLLLGIVAGTHADVVVPDNGVASVPIRASASAQGRQIGVLNADQSLPYVASVPRWYQVKLPDGSGFVSKAKTNLVADADAGANTPAAMSGGSTAADQFRIDSVDVGTGLAIVVTGPDFTLVYDGGSNDDLAVGSKNRLLAFLKHDYPNLTKIDHLILSHPHRDHVELLPDLFGAYVVRQVWDSGAINPICGYRRVIRAISTEDGVIYHSALHDTGTYTIDFQSAANCNGASLPATISLAHGSRIGDQPIQLGHKASMQFLYADGSHKENYNDNSLVLALTLGDTHVLLMGDAQAGERASPTSAPDPHSIEGILVACCAAELKSDIMVVGHHGSKTSSRAALLNAVSAKFYIVSSGPTVYGHVVLPDQEVIDQLTARGQVFRTDLNDASCPTNPAKIGPDNNGRAGGCDDIRIDIRPNNQIAAKYAPESD